MANYFASWSVAISAALVKSGLADARKRFVAKGRDGVTDIYGVINRPTNFDPEEEVSGHREHLRRTAGRVRAEEFQLAEQHAESR